MEPTAFIIAILGCADGAVDCRPVATAPQAYRSVAECKAARDAALDDHSALDFPTLVAECRKADRETLSRLKITLPARA